MAVILPLCYVGCHCLIRHNQRAYGLQDLTHLAVVILDGATAVLTKHQPANAVIGRDGTAVVILHVVFWIVGIADGVVLQSIFYYFFPVRKIQDKLKKHLSSICILKHSSTSFFLIITILFA